MAELQMATIVFADVAGSTSLYEHLGDKAARQIMAACLERITATVESYDGRVIKTIGDEVMSVFSSAADGMLASVAIQENVASDPRLARHGIKLRVGLHHGQVIQEEQDVFGDAVNLAARVAAQAKADQILTTGQTLELVETGKLKGTRLVDQTRVKGKQQPVRLYEVFWGQLEDMTMVGGGAVNPSQAALLGAEASLTIQFGGKIWTLGPRRPTLSIGRGDTNDLIVDDRHVSRLHARIELLRKRFFIIDHSTNGTYINCRGSDCLFLHREQLPLEGQGLIGCGQQPDPGSPLAIAYQVKNGRLSEP